VTSEARDRLASGCEESVAGLEARLVAATATSNSLAAQLADHAGAAETLVKGLETAVVDVDSRLAMLDGVVRERTRAVGDALTELGTTIDGFGDRSARGQDEVAKLLSGTDAVLTAIDAVTRELDETVPAAFGRIETSAGSARTLIADLGAPLASGASMAKPGSPTPRRMPHGFMKSWAPCRPSGWAR
jgi:ABC-type transporter Mla subunit MlaD